MNPKHVLDFVDFKIDDLQKKYADSLSKYNKLMAEYKAMPFYKRWFANNPKYGYWSWQVGEYYIEQLNDIKREALYKNKMDYMRMDINSDWHKAFYKWADTNKIPY